MKNVFRVPFPVEFILPISKFKMVRKFILIALLCMFALTCAAEAGGVTFTDEVNPNLTLSGGSYPFLHDINTIGFNPGTYSITDASLTLYFFDNGLGTDDSVEVRFDGGILGGIVHDPSGFALEAFQGTLSVPPSHVQSDGALSVTLFPGNVIFQRSVLEVQTVQGASPPPPPGTTTLSLSNENDPEPNTNLATGQYTYSYNIIPLGFNPLTDLITDASLTLDFFDNGLGTDDSVDVRFDGGILGGIVHDPSGFEFDAFQSTLNVPSGLLQTNGMLSFTLQSADAYFDRSVLEVNYLRSAAAPVPEPSTLASARKRVVGVGRIRHAAVQDVTRYPQKIFEERGRKPRPF